MLEVWDVEEDGEHRDDALIYMADSGTVFRRGTCDVAAERIQMYFEADDKDFAVSLQGAYKEAAKAHRATLRAEEKGGAFSAYRDALDELDEME